jgi:hypothetical protein
VNLVFPQDSTTLLFTRNIADPRFGVRLTGKIGPYSLGFLEADDRSPGETVAASNPGFGTSAYVTAIRLSRDIFGFGARFSRIASLMAATTGCLVSTDELS